VILSRGDLDNTRKEQCEKLERLGAKVYYHVVDITDMKALQAIYAAIKQEIGDIHGVINLARVHDSKSIALKTWESFYGVSQVKMMGTLNLDLLTKEEHLDIFMLFASIGGYGARGDSDYAFSVAFQNAFARHRNQLRKEGQRHGIAVSQCWGPWEEDKLFPESRKKMSSLGLDLINMRSAFQWIEASCVYEDAVIGICAVLDKEKAKAVLGMKADNNIHALLEKWEHERSEGRSIDITVIQKAISIEEMKNMDISLVERIYKLSFERIAGAGISDNISVIRELVIQVLQVEDLDNEKPFQDYGLDSIMAMKLSTNLEKKLKREVKPHLLIEFPTVKELSHHLNSTNKGILI
jgi:acyl carrier protein/NAD(P)-dependent dehydrogenase (short-subunit alcohol dehydrogenase family)